jgi:serine/threonine protein kinase/Tol biopolymer transport system component
MVGRTLGSYRIVEKLGAGGMGEVYRATDVKLRRDVAIKILPEAFAADADRLARFEREARVLASLNHPHIAGIHGLEEDGDVRALVLELVEGATLAERLLTGPLSVTEALAYSRQIAEALEAAHEKGVCHRDLKPSNIKITPDGQVKVLDFGLAKADEARVRADVSHSPTITAVGTGANVILGTAAYMSPEQARGKAVDRRADVWALGCVLFEMLTARQAFAGETVLDTLSAILNREPDWHRLPAETPPAIRRLLRHCFAKDVKRRMHDIADARIEIEDALDTDSAMPETGQPNRAVGVSIGTIALSVALLGIGVAAGMLLKRPSSASGTSTLPPVRYTIPADGIAAGAIPAVSRDGRRIAFVASKADSPSAIWVQALDEERPRELPGTSGGSDPFWSPDGRSLAFFADGALRRVDLMGGPAQRIARVEESLGGAWGSSDVIVFSARYALYQVPASGGTPVLVAGLDLSRQENSVRAPEFLPDGRHFLYSARSGRPENTSIYLASLDGGAPQRIVNTRWAVHHTLPDVLMYVRDEALVAQSFDIDRKTLTGTPRQILGPIDPNYGGLDFFSVSDTGVVVYRLLRPASSQLTWVDRRGAASSTIGEPSLVSNFRLSPEERRVVFDETNRGSRSVWTLDLATSARSRLTFPGSDDWQPIWSHDGLRVLFGSYRNGPIDMYIKPASGGGSDQEFMRSPIQKGPRDWSRDGRFILYTQDSPEMKEDLYARDTSDTGAAIAIAATSAREFDGRFSPNGRWVSYVSTETGTNEIYVQPFPPTGGKWQVSVGGGHSPRWRGDGRELFYLTPQGDMKVVAVTAATNGQPFTAGEAQTLFHVAGIRSGAPGNTAYEVTGDGQRFLLNLLKGSPPPPSISVILNWAALQ